MTSTADTLSPPRPSNGLLEADTGLPWHDPEWFRDLDATEERCRAYLEDLRWPDGVSCPRCESPETGRLAARRKFWCRRCKYQFRVTSGTLFHDSHAPVWKWFLAVRLLLDSDGGLPANQLVRQLGGSYKTAWFIEHRVRAALQETRSRPCLAFDATGESGQPEGRRVYDRTIVGCYHQHAVKHLHAYLAEREWLSHNTGNPNVFRDVIAALLDGAPLPYSELTRSRRRPVGVAGLRRGSEQDVSTAGSAEMRPEVVPRP